LLVLGDAERQRPARRDANANTSPLEAPPMESSRIASHPPSASRPERPAGGEMTSDPLDKLAALVKQERESVLSRWRTQVRELPAARGLDIPTLNDHIPLLLDELIEALRAKSAQTIPEAISEGSSTAHGLQRVQDSFDIEEVVAEYNILRGCIHDLADDNGLNLRGKPLYIINRVFDLAIGLALKTYATQRALDVQQRREEYLAFVAHDLRTPLNAISLAGRVLELTLQPQGASGDVSQMLKALRRNVQHLEALVGKVLEENTNLETEIGLKLERREFDLWPLVESLVHDLHPVAGTDSTQLSNNVPDDLVVFADASLLKRSLQNLIANAIKYTPRGRVDIDARELGADGVVECWISDNGAGISKEFLGKIFDKGESDPAIEGGAGLGLSIVKAFIEAHDGKVSVESELGVGSTFRFSLPCKPRASGAVNR
jgi:signal transduction histidine kinase